MQTGRRGNAALSLRASLSKARCSQSCFSLSSLQGSRCSLMTVMLHPSWVTIFASSTMRFLSFAERPLPRLRSRSVPSTAIATIPSSLIVPR